MRTLLWCGLGLRGSLLLYGMVMDRTTTVKYTDYDYKVFSDASARVLEGRSPYDRITYRYTPLLAYLLTPNIFLIYEFGKLLFAVLDILCAWLLDKILTRLNVNPQLKLYAIGFWLFFPLGPVVSTRGNADCLIVFLSLLTLHLILEEKVALAAIVYGLAVHFKIYPIIHALPFFLFIDSKNETKAKSTVDWVRSHISWPRVKFALLSAGVFLLLGGLFYALYGYQFLFEAYLYHFVRKDHRHNMSMYFYSVHLFYDSVYGKWIGLLAFVPQWLLVIIVGLVFYKDISVCMFFQSVIFVMFNKVCTAQYFVWFLGVFPLILPTNRLFAKHKLIFAGLFVLITASEVLILNSAYQLEILGENRFLDIFYANIVFFVVSLLSFGTILYSHPLFPFPFLSSPLALALAALFLFLFLVAACCFLKYYL